MCAREDTQGTGPLATTTAAGAGGASSSGSICAFPGQSKPLQRQARQCPTPLSMPTGASLHAKYKWDPELSLHGLCYTYDRKHLKVHSVLSDSEAVIILVTAMRST